MKSKLNKFPLELVIIGFLIANLLKIFNYAVKLTRINSSMLDAFINLIETDYFYAFLMTLAVLIALIALFLNQKSTTKNVIYYITIIIGLLTMVLALYNLFDFYMTRTFYML